MRELLNGDLNMKRYHCPECGYTWVEFVGLIVEKRNGLEDVHFRVGDGTPSECEECGCCYVFEVSLSEENLRLKGRFEGIRRIVHGLESEEAYKIQLKAR